MSTEQLAIISREGMAETQPRWPKWRNRAFEKREEGGRRYRDFIKMWRFFLIRLWEKGPSRREGGNSWTGPIRGDRPHPARTSSTPPFSHIEVGYILTSTNQRCPTRVNPIGWGEGRTEPYRLPITSSSSRLRTLMTPVALNGHQTRKPFGSASRPGPLATRRTGNHTIDGHSHCWRSASDFVRGIGYPMLRTA